MLGLTVGATATGRLVRLTGRYKLFPIVGFAIAAASFAILVAVTRTTPPFVYTAAMALLGVGLGPMGPSNHDRGAERGRAARHGGRDIALLVLPLDGRLVRRGAFGGDPARRPDRDGRGRRAQPQRHCCMAGRRRYATLPEPLRLAVIAGFTHIPFRATFTLSAR